MDNDDIAWAKGALISLTTNIITLEDWIGHILLSERTQSEINALTLEMMDYPKEQYRIIHFIGKCFIECDNAHEHLLPTIKIMYDIGMLSESVLLEWYYSPEEGFADKSLKLMIKPMIDWLEIAEEESDER